MRRFFKITTFLLISILFSFHYQSIQSNHSEYYSLHISRDVFDFKECKTSDTPFETFFIAHLIDKNEAVIGSITPSAEWIQLSTNTFQGITTEVNVTLHLKNLSLGSHEEQILIHCQYADITLPVRVTIVEKKKNVIINFDNARIIRSNQYEVLNAAPFVLQGLRWLPLRPICEEMGIELHYDSETRQTVINHNNYSIILVTNSDFDQSYIIVNGRQYDHSIFPIIRSSFTFLPMDFYSKILGLTVQSNNNRLVVVLK
ncbi:MAG: stalk domain-containing protein [Caldisericia bacterium]|nr:stalk domain-containing protein [Caldisericia bacterium]